MITSITDGYTGLKLDGGFGLADDAGEVSCPVCGADPAQQCTVPDPRDNNRAVELGRFVHIERIQPNPMT